LSVRNRGRYFGGRGRSGCTLGVGFVQTLVDVLVDGLFFDGSCGGLTGFSSSYWFSRLVTR